MSRAPTERRARPESAYLAPNDISPPSAVDPRRRHSSHGPSPARHPHPHPDDPHHHNGLGPVSGPGPSRPHSPDRRQKTVIKRLIACLDGTWMNSDHGMIRGKVQVESNVTRIARAIKPESRDGIQQIVYYGKGIGSTGGYLDRIVRGAIGEGLNQNVREAYSFICNNYEPGDEIFLFGFSRGAFTARTVAGLISIIGVLTKRGLHYLSAIFMDVLHRRDKHYDDKQPNAPFRNKPPADDPDYVEELYRRGLTYPDVPIRVVGVWDTVGSLGIPRIGLLQNLGIQKEESKEMQFYDTRLGYNVENAFQALALDESRSSFAPAIWEKPQGNKTKLRQVWFPGSHGNCGGGFEDEELATISLTWMMSQVSEFLDFDDDYILDQYDENVRYYRSRRKKVRRWGFGEIYNSTSGVYSLGGSKTRTPGEYYRVAPDGSETNTPLRDTHEYIHASARIRFVLRGPGKADQGDYEAPALKNWRLSVEYPHGPDGRPRISWKARFKTSNVSTRILPEAPIWGYERDLLSMDREIEDEVMRPPPTRR